MPITRRAMAADPIVVGSSRFTPVAGDTTASLRFPGGLLQVGYARPLRIVVDDGTDPRPIRIPDRQLLIMLSAFVVWVIGRLMERRRRT
ncbi:MAG: hypothetical protein RI637_00480 [Acidimicrobiia bacterium]|nr:hypothetical protein [Acidimicrobiia bacterium]